MLKSYAVINNEHAYFRSWRKSYFQTNNIYALRERNIIIEPLVLFVKKKKKKNECIQRAFLGESNGFRALEKNDVN